jgi:hypothetical protein
MVSSPKKRSDLDLQIRSLKESWAGFVAKASKTASKAVLFDSDGFQSGVWKPFEERLSKEYKDMSPNWRQQLLLQVREELIREG